MKQNELVKKQVQPEQRTIIDEWFRCYNTSLEQYAYELIQYVQDLLLNTTNIDPNILDVVTKTVFEEAYKQMKQKEEK